MSNIEKLIAKKTEYYSKILRKKPEIIIEKINYIRDPSKLLKFKKKFGVIFNEISENRSELSLFSIWNESEFFIELGVILSFIPERFRSMKRVRRILFLSLFTERLIKILHSSDLYHFYLDEMEIIQNNISIQFAGGFPRTVVQQYIQSVSNDEIIKKVIPFIDSGVKKGDIVENLYFIFKPHFQFNYSIIKEIDEVNRFYKEIGSSEKKIYFKIPISYKPYLVWDYCKFGLNTIMILIQGKPNIIEQEKYKSYLRNNLDLLPFLINHNMLNDKLLLVAVIPKKDEIEWIELLKKKLERLKSVWIDSFFIGSYDSIYNKIKPYDLSLKTGKITDFNSSKPYEPYEFSETGFYCSNIIKKDISQIDLFFCLNYRNLLPDFQYLKNENDFLAKLQINMKKIINSEQSVFKIINNEWVPFSQKRFPVQKLKEILGNLYYRKMFQPASLSQLISLEFEHCIFMNILTSKQNPLIENYFSLYNRFQIKQNGKIKYWYYLTTNWRDYLLLFPLLNLQPNWIFGIIEMTYRNKNLNKLIVGFNIDSQQWDSSFFNLEELNKSLNLPIKINHYLIEKHPPEIPKVPLCEISINSINEIKRYHRVYDKLVSKFIQSTDIEELLQKLFLSPTSYKIPSGKLYSSLRNYLHKYENLNSPTFPAPINGFFTRIHIIFQSRTISVHPESLKTDPTLKGIFTIGLIQCWYFGGHLDGILLLEYYVPNLILSDPHHDFTRLLKRIQKPRTDVYITVLEVESSQTFYNSYYLKVEEWKVGEFLRIRSSHAKPLINGFTSVLFHQFKPTAVEPRADLVKDWFDDSHLPYYPVFGDWYLWLFLKHPITQFIWIKNVSNEELDLIYSFFRQAPIGEIYTCKNLKSKKRDLYILLRYHRHLSWMVQKIYHFFISMQFDGYRTFVFPWTRFSASNIAHIIYISRKQPWYHNSCAKLQFPIFRPYQRNHCYSVEEQLQMYELIQIMQKDRRGKIPIGLVRKEYEKITKKKREKKILA